jgi:hypothetical protein
MPTAAILCELFDAGCTEPDWPPPITDQSKSLMGAGWNVVPRELVCTPQIIAAGEALVENGDDGMSALPRRQRHAAVLLNPDWALGRISQSGQYPDS